MYVTCSFMIESSRGNLTIEQWWAAEFNLPCRGEPRKKPGNLSILPRTKLWALIMLLHVCDVGPS